MRVVFRHDIIGGELVLRTENKAPPYFKISVSDDLEKDVYELASTVGANIREFKGEVERARGLVRHCPVNLQPYEEYLDGIEGEARDLIRRTKCQLYDVDSDRWPQMREALAKIDDELLKLVEALPDY